MNFISDSEVLNALTVLAIERW